MMSKAALIRMSATIFTLTLLHCTLLAQENIAKEIREEYTVNNNSNLEIKNSYGKIDITTWNKNKVVVRVQIIFDGIDQDKVAELLELIDIRNNTSGSKIAFETEYNDKFHRTFNRLSHNNRNFEVNYMVQAPENLPLNLANKYGNTFIDKNSATSTIRVKYGNLKVNELISSNKNNMSSIDLGYSNAEINTCSWLKINMKYSKISIEQSKALIVLSKYSKIKIQSGSSLVTESAYDEYKIGTIANFVTEAAYSHFKFESIGKKLHTITKYSDVKVDFIPASFEEITIENKYGSYRLGIAPNAQYKIDGVAKYADIVCPSNRGVNRFKENNETRVEGYVISENASARIKIKTDYGTVRLTD